MKEVTIEARRSLAGGSTTSTRRLSSEEIRKMNATTLGDVVAGIPGLHVRQYGSLGGIQTVSFRGLSAEHSSISIDGVPINNLQTGLTDLSIVPLNLVESIEVSGIASDHAGGGLGGSIDIRSAAQMSTPGLSLSGSIGSFAMENLAIRSTLSVTRNTRITLSIARARERGNYPFNESSPGAAANALLRSNADYSSYNMFLGASTAFSQRVQGRLSIVSMSANRGVPGPYLSSGTNSDGRQEDVQFLSIARIDAALSGRLYLAASISLQRLYERFYQTSTTRADNYYRNTLLYFKPELRYDLSSKLTLSAAFDVRHALANGNALERPVVRTHSALMASLSYVPLHDSSQGVVLGIRPSLRIDISDEWHPAWNPSITLESGVRIPGAKLGVHASVARVFQLPSINALYYAGSGGIGNLHLRPESALRGEGGVSLEWNLLGLQKSDVTFFSITTKDYIQWLPTSIPTIWSPSNIGRTKSTGVELNHAWNSIGGLFRIDGAYTFLDARKHVPASIYDPTVDRQLVYVPLESGRVGISIMLPGFFRGSDQTTLSVSDLYTGVRYTNEDNSNFLPAFHRVDAAIEIKALIFTLQAIVKYEVSNIADINYEIMARYPMPGRTHRVTLTLHKYFEDESL